MPDGVKKIGDARLAQRFIGTAFEEMELPWASDYYDTCISLDIEEKACKTLDIALGGQRNITWVDIASLKDIGFSDEFINELAGKDGRHFAEMRLQNLSKRAVTRWWRADLSPWRRKQAIDEIAKYESDGAYAVPYLIEALDDDDRDVKEAALSALRHIGPPAHKAVPKLIQLLKERDDEILEYAAIALGAIHADPEKSVPALLKYCKWFAVNTFINVIASFGRPAVSFLIAEIDKEASSKNEPYFIDLIYELGKIGTDANEAWPYLVKLVEEKVLSQEAEKAIAYTLLDIGAPPETAIPKLISALKKMDEIRRLDWYHLAPRLVKLSYIPDDLFSLLAPNIEHSIDEVVIAILKKASPHLAKPVLIKMLTRYSNADRSAEVLSEMVLEPGDMDLIVEKAASSYINASALKVALQDVSSDCVDRLMAVSASGEKKSRLAATGLLGFVGRGRKDVIDYLVHSLIDNESQGDAMQALEEIGEEAIPFLLPRIKEEGFKERSLAVYVLGQIHLAPEKVLPELEAISNERDDAIRKAVAISFGYYATHHPGHVLPLLPMVSEYARDANSEVRYEWIRCIYMLGPKARDALPMLDELRITDPDPKCREITEAAINKILAGIL